MKHKPKCIYCSKPVEKIDYEGVCTNCHKINDEDIEDNNIGECVFCNCEIDLDNCSYVEGEGDSCNDCACYCEECQESHYHEDVEYCDSCGKHTCRDHTTCNDCSSRICSECYTVCSDCNKPYCEECGDSICKDCKKDHNDNHKEEEREVKKNNGQTK